MKQLQGFFRNISYTNNTNTMKTITLTVNLKLDSDMSDDNEIREVVENTLNALVIHCEESFITPLMSDNYITEIEVKEHFTETTVNKKF